MSLQTASPARAAIPSTARTTVSNLLRGIPNPAGEMKPTSFRVAGTLEPASHALRTPKLAA